MSYNFDHRITLSTENLRVGMRLLCVKDGILDSLHFEDGGIYTVRCHCRIRYSHGYLYSLSHSDNSKTGFLSGGMICISTSYTPQFILYDALSKEEKFIHQMSGKTKFLRDVT